MTLEGYGPRQGTPQNQGGRSPSGRLFDAYIDSVEIDSKTPDAEATSSTMRNRANESKHRDGQARNLIFDVRHTGMAMSETPVGVARIPGAYSKYYVAIRVIADEYDFTQRI